MPASTLFELFREYYMPAPASTWFELFRENFSTILTLFGTFIGAVLTSLYSFIKDYSDRKMNNLNLEYEEKKEKRREEKLRIEKMYDSYLRIEYEISAKIKSFESSVFREENFRLEGAFDELKDRILSLKIDSELYYYEKNSRLINSIFDQIEFTTLYLNCFQDGKNPVNFSGDFKTMIINDLGKIQRTLKDQKSEYTKFLRDQMPKQ